MRGNAASPADVVHRAAEVVDHEAAHDGVADLLRRFEDRDEPVAADTDAAG